MNFFQYIFVLIFTTIWWFFVGLVFALLYLHREMFFDFMIDINNWFHHPIITPNRNMNDVTKFLCQGTIVGLLFFINYCRHTQKCRRCKSVYYYRERIECTHCTNQVATTYWNQYWKDYNQFKQNENFFV